MTKRLRDKQLEVTKALPATASAITTDPIDTGNGPDGDFVAGTELVIEAPALAVGELADTETVVYDVVMDTDSELGSVTVVLPGVITQTGAGGAGAAAATKRIKLPDAVERYVAVRATHSAGDDASAKSVVAYLAF